MSRITLSTFMRPGLLVLVIAGFATLIPASATGPLIDDRESNPGGTVIQGYNTADGTGVEGITQSSGGFGVVGIAQVTTSGPNTIGTYGAATGPNSYGMFANGSGGDAGHPSSGLLATSSNGAGLWATTTRADYAATITFNTTSTTGVGLSATGSGNAIVGSSFNANGTLASTLANSGFGGAGQAGVLGQDLATDQGPFNSGVAGVSKSGYGISGTTTAEGPGVGGFSSAGIGVFGSSGNNAGVTGVSLNGIGALGNSSSNIGLLAESQAPPDGSGVNGPPALLVSSDGGAPAIKAVGNSGDIMSLDANGNMIISGNLTVDGNISVAGTNGGSGSCSSCPTPLAVQRTAANVSVGTYTPQQTVRSLEDLGEGRMVNGQAYVRIDPAFASATDPNSSYLVFITPLGDSTGVFVTQKTRNGFLVKENQNGHGMIAFDYRISAKPLGSVEPRLPVLSASRTRAAQGTRPLHTAIGGVRALATSMKLRAQHRPVYRVGFVPRAMKPPSVPRLHR